MDAARPSAQFYAPGPIVEAEILQPAHPIFYGYTEQRGRRCAMPTVRCCACRTEDRGQVGADAISRHGPIGPERTDAGRGGNPRAGRRCVDVPVGQGRVILFATNPCYRWQNLGEFNMLANAILYYKQLGRR